MDYRDRTPGARQRPGTTPDGQTPAQPADTEADDGWGDAPVEQRSWCVTADEHGQRLDRVMVAHAAEFSRSHLQSEITRGAVLLDGQVCVLPSRKLRAGQQALVSLRPTAEALAFRPEAVPLVVVHEDDAVLVLNKPAGLVVHPGAGNWSGTLLNGLLHRDPQAQFLPRAGIVHRLDKGTSGLMVVGRTLPAVTALSRAIAEREVRREYAALAHGDVGADDLVVDAPVGRDPRSALRMAVTAAGRPARTEVHPLGFASGVSAVRCRLHTGRTHQIRVHLAHLGHPLVSDPTYGGALALGLQRPALHAFRLAFAHPITGELLCFEAPLPEDLASAWAQVMTAGPETTQTRAR